MKKYFFYYKNDSKQEPIGYCDYNSEEEALLFFSKQKKLKPNIFLKIFKISIK
jgi:hypothetical protein